MILATVKLRHTCHTFFQISCFERRIAILLVLLCRGELLFYSFHIRNYASRWQDGVERAVFGFLYILPF